MEPVLVCGDAQQENDWQNCNTVILYNSYFDVAKGS